MCPPHSWYFIHSCTGLSYRYISWDPSLERAVSWSEFHLIWMSFIVSLPCVAVLCLVGWSSGIMNSDKFKGSRLKAKRFPGGWSPFVIVVPVEIHGNIGWCKLRICAWELLSLHPPPLQLTLNWWLQIVVLSPEIGTPMMSVVYLVCGKESLFVCLFVYFFICDLFKDADSSSDWIAFSS